MAIGAEVGTLLADLRAAFDSCDAERAAFARDLRAACDARRAAQSADAADLRALVARGAAFLYPESADGARAPIAPRRRPRARDACRAR